PHLFGLAASVSPAPLYPALAASPGDPSSVAENALAPRRFATAPLPADFRSRALNLPPQNDGILSVLYPADPLSLPKFAPLAPTLRAWPNRCNRGNCSSASLAVAFGARSDCPFQ